MLYGPPDDYWKLPDIQQFVQDIGLTINSISVYHIGYGYGQQDTRSFWDYMKFEHRPEYHGSHIDVLRYTMGTARISLVSLPISICRQALSHLAEDPSRDLDARLTTRRMFHVH